MQSISSRSSFFPHVTGSFFLVSAAAAGYVATTPIIRAGSVIRPSFTAVAILCFVVAVALVAGRHRPRIIAASKGLLVLWATVLALFATLEVSFPFALPLLPLNVQPFVTRPFNRLCQSSKERTVPRNYIAIFGDSYAQGFGDWLIASNPWTNGPYHSADVLHRKLGVDVLSFGKSGASSIGGLVRTPINELRVIRYRFDLSDPSIVLAYFFEGNDLSDNLEELFETGYFQDRTPRRLNRDEFFGWLDHEVLKPKVGEQGIGRLLGAKFVLSLVKNFRDRLRGHRMVLQKVDRFTVSGNYNETIVGAQKMHLPDRLQGPALELSAEETAIALQVFDLSLQRVKHELRPSQFYVVYVPSVLSCYALRGDISAQTVWGRPEIHPARSVWARSEQIADWVRQISERDGAEFVDPRPVLREAASEQPVHGPIDWTHFNRRGYELLAQAILDTSTLRGTVAKIR